MMFIHHSDSFVSRLMSSSQASAGPWNKNLKILTWKFYSSKLHAFKIRRRRTTLSVPSVVSFLYVRIFPVLTRHSFPDFDCPCPPSRGAEVCSKHVLKQSLNGNYWRLTLTKKSTSALSLQPIFSCNQFCFFLWLKVWNFLLPGRRSHRSITWS